MNASAPEQNLAGVKIMNIAQTADQKVQILKARVLWLGSKLSGAESAIEDLKGEKAVLEESFMELCDYSDDEVRREFLSRGFIDPVIAEYERLADHIARGETNDALSLLAEISEGAVSSAVAKMLTKAHAQESLL